MRGVKVFGVADNVRSPYCRTRAVDVVVTKQAFSENPGMFSKPGVRPVLFACTDETVWWLNDERERIGLHADFLLAPRDTLRLLADKDLFYRYAMAHNLPLPETRFVRSQDEIKAVLPDLRFPLLIKPPRRSKEWLKATGGFKVLKVDGPDKLMEIAADLLAVTGELILQRWIAGSDKHMHSLFICMGRDGEPLARIVAKKLRQWPPDVGVGCLALQVDQPEVEEIGISVLRQAGFCGIGSLQFKVEEGTGRPFIIEMNTGRTVLNMQLCEVSGMEMIYTYCCAAAGLPLPENRTVKYPGCKWICWKTDLASAYVHWRRGDLGIGEWLGTLRGKKWTADVFWRDPLPMFLDLFGKIGKSRTRTSKK